MNCTFRVSVDLGWSGWTRCPEPAVRFFRDGDGGSGGTTVRRCRQHASSVPARLTEMTEDEALAYEVHRR